MYINLFTRVLLCFTVGTVLWDIGNYIQTIRMVGLWSIKVKQMPGWTWIKLFYKLVWQINGPVLFTTVC